MHPPARCRPRGVGQERRRAARPPAQGHCPGPGRPLHLARQLWRRLPARGPARRPTIRSRSREGPLSIDAPPTATRLLAPTLHPPPARAPLGPQPLHPHLPHLVAPDARPSPRPRAHHVPARLSRRPVAVPRRPDRRGPLQHREPPRGPAEGDTRRAQAPLGGDRGAARGVGEGARARQEEARQRGEDGHCCGPHGRRGRRRC